MAFYVPPTTTIATSTPDVFSPPYAYTASATLTAATGTATEGSFLQMDGTCGPEPNLLKSRWEWILFFILILIGGIVTSIFNFWSGGKMARRERLFSKSFLFQFFIGVVARMCGPAIVLAIVKGSQGVTDSDQVLTQTSLRAAMWGAFLGLHPGSIMGMMQLLKKSWNAIAINQILADMMLTWVGLGHIWMGEYGAGPKIAIAGYRSRVLVGAWLYGISLLAVLVVFVAYRCREAHKEYKKYEYFEALWLRVLIFFLSSALCVGGVMMLTVATSLCGKPLAVSDGIGTGVQLVLSSILCFLTKDVGAVLPQPWA